MTYFKTGGKLLWLVVLLCWQGDVSAGLSLSVSSNGIPFLLSDGRIIPQDSFSTDANNPGVTFEEFQKAAGNGIRLIFPRRMITAQHDGSGGLTFDKSVLDTGMQNLVADNPNAQFVLYIAGNPQGNWHTFHTNLTRLKDFEGNYSVFADPNSEIFRTAVRAYIREIVQYVEQQPYAAAVAGYHVDFFDGGEFMLPLGYYGYSDASRIAFQNWLSNKYSSVSALNVAWNNDANSSFDEITVPAPAEFSASDSGAFRDPVVRRNVIDFSRFWQEMNAGLIIDVCRTVKESSAGNPLTGVFYGYTFETVQSFYKGHSALRSVLDSPFVDFLSAPYSYVYRITSILGVEDADCGAGAFHGPVDSILQNGKLFFSEDDSRTFLTAETNQAGHSRFSDLPETKAMFRRNHLINLCRGSGLWRLDLFSTGWYNSNEIMRELGMQRKLTEHLLQTPDYLNSQYLPDVAVIIDERSMEYVSTQSVSNAVPSVSVDKILRDHLHRAGVSCGFYLLDDLIAGRVPDCSAYIFAGTYRFTGAERAWIRENLKKDNKTLIWFFASGLYDETEWGTERMSDLIEMDIAEASEPAPSGIRATSSFLSVLQTNISWDSTGIVGQPEWYVENLSSNAVVLAEYVHESVVRPAVVLENKTGWNSLYIGTTGLRNKDWFPALVKQVNLKRCVETDVSVPCYIGRGLIGIWAAEPVNGSVNLKEYSDVYDLYSGELMFTNTNRFPVTLNQWEFGAYKIQPAGEKWTSGLFFQWQQQFFSDAEINAGDADAEKDSDRDGFTNFQEFLNDTNPVDKYSFPYHSLSMDSTGLTVSFSTSSNRIYNTFYRTNLLTGSWIPLSNGIHGTGSTIHVIDTNLYNQSFYLIDTVFK